MRYIELLNEHVVNAFDPATKQKFASQVWEVLQKSYAPVGGFLSASSVDELISDSGLWKIITRNGEVSAVGIYKDQYGRKSIASGTNGTPRGKLDYLMLKDDDIKFSRCWAEVSGVPERMLKKSGAKPLPSKFAAILTGKEILSYNEDGVHYTRFIAGHPHEKAIYGAVDVTSALVDKLNQAGIQLHELPGAKSLDLPAK